MKTTMALWATAIVALTCGGSLQAHHSGSMYQPTPLWVTGTVVRFDNINPHTIATLEQRGADGQVRRWAVEGPGQSQLDRMGIAMEAPKVGDVVEFCAFPYKSAEELSRMFPGVDFSVRRSSRGTDDSSLEFVWGHVMTTPDGDRQLWNPHGMISECIRSSDDQTQSWLDFVNSDPRIRRSWCEQRGYMHVRSNASLREFVEEINSLIDKPCE